jgi:undecaprenyl pyrophosphate phosphatase UppP
MLICLKVFVEWLETGTCWNFKNYRFSICTSSTTGWTYSIDFVAAFIGSVMEITSSIDTTSSTWMLLITLYRLVLGYSSMLPWVIVTSSSFPPLPPISSKHVCSSSSS